MPDRPLTYKQELFCEYYLGECAGNATDAARKAGYMGDDNTLAVVGHDNLKNPKIAERVRGRVVAVAMTADEVLAQLSDVGRAEWRELLEIKIGGKNPDGSDRVVYVRMDLTNKVKSLELLGKYHKLFTEKIETTAVHKAIIGIDLDDI